MVVTSKHRTHKVMEAAIRELMGAGTPPRFKFKDTYASIEFPTGYTIPAEATLEAKYDELLALEEGIQKTVMEGDLEVGTSNLFVDTQTGNVGIGTDSPAYTLDVHGSSNVGALTATTVSGDGSGITSLNASNLASGTIPSARLSLAASDIPNLDATKITSGTLTRPISTTTGTFSGDVGIGTTNPQTKLNVHGSVSTGRNLAREVGTVISYNSQFNNSRGAANIINGDKNFEIHNSDWITASGQRNNAYVVIDLGTARSVDRLVIYNQNEYSDSRREVKGFQLHGSNDNSTWTTVITSECGRSNAHEANPGWSFRIPQNWDDDAEGTSYRYWKFIMTSFHGTDGHGGIMELELYESSNTLDDEVSTGSLVAQDVYSETGNFSRGATIGKGYGGTSTGANNLLVEGNVGIGTTNPTKSLEINGTTLRHAREYRYQADWQSNNNQTFTIPVTGGSARGEMLVEAEVIQVAANSSGERVARVRGVITNYHTGNFYMTVFEGENATAFETYIVGASLGASGTFTMKYQPQAGYQQDVRCRLNLKIFIGGYTSSLGSLTRTDAGSNSALTAPTLNSAPKIFGGNVGVGTTNPMNTGLHIANSYFASGGNTTHLDPQIFITGDSGTGGNQVSAIGFSGNSSGDTHQRMVAGSVYYKGGGGNYGLDGYLGIAVANSSAGGSDPYGLTESELESHTRIAIKNNGNVGIGVTSPGAKLDVNGTIRTSTTSTNIATGSGSDVTINSTTPTTFASVTITTRGNKVLVICSGDLQPSSGTSDWLDLRFYRANTAIGKHHRYHSGTASSTNQVFAMHVIDQPSAGTYTYYAKGFRGNGNTFFGEHDNPQITAIEFL